VVINYLPVGRSQAKCCVPGECWTQAARSSTASRYSSCEATGERFRRTTQSIRTASKSQIRTTITRRVLTRLFADRGCTSTAPISWYDTEDFLGLLERERLESKISQDERDDIADRFSGDADNDHVGPGGPVPWLEGRRVVIRVEGRRSGRGPQPRARWSAGLAELAGVVVTRSDAQACAEDGISGHCWPRPHTS